MVAPEAPPPTIVEIVPAPAPEPEVFESTAWNPKLQLHGFVSEGGFVSTDNEFIGTSSRGSLKLLEVGVNVTLELLDQLRVGVQLVVRSVGTVSEDAPRLDWAVVDYRLQPWLGLRAGVIKLPLGLYNEYVDIDSARTAILMPQSLYKIRNRDALISHTGFAVYGALSIGDVGALDYQAWLGTLSIPPSALELTTGTLDSVDTKYVTGGQLFWRLPLEGLRVGATYMRAEIDFHVTLDPATITQLIVFGAVPSGYDGKVLVKQRPTGIWVASAEYTVGDWLFAAEYSRWLKHQETSLPDVIATIDEEAERFYGLATYRLTPHYELGIYYSVTVADVDDRGGRSENLTEDFQAWQRDLAATIRIDINDYWLWKLEGHFIDGVAELQASQNPSPERYWGLFLFRTTVTF